MKLVENLRSMNPAAQIVLTNSAVGSSSPPFCTLCLEALMPPDEEVDLVLVDFSPNLEADAQLLQATPVYMMYERLIRRLLTWKGAPAVVLVQMLWPRNVHWMGNRTIDFVQTTEDAVGVLAQYYGIPTVSMRNALWLKQRNAEPGFGQEMRMVSAELNSHQELCDDYFDFPTAPLRPSLLEPDNHEIMSLKDGKYKLCAIGPGLMPFVALQDQAWEYNSDDRHNRKFGYIGRTNGSKLHLVIPHPATGTAPLVAFISYLKSYDNMGEAHITCILGCSCKYTKLQGSWSTQASVSHLKPVELSNFEVGSSCTMQAAKPRITVGLDFGTTGTGFAFSVGLDAGNVPASQSSMAIKEFHQYPDTPLRGYPKDLTAVLYKGRTALACGYTARKLWNALSPAERVDGSHAYLTGAAIKLSLNSAQEAQYLPAGITPLMAAADFLSLFRRTVMLHLGRAVASALNVTMHSDMIQWCITVPAQWSDASKATVRNAALRAGIISKLDSPQLMIILEPEAAALHAKTLRAIELAVGDVFMVVDAGGGTVDVTVEEQGGELLLAEMVSAEGAYAGSTYVDRNFEAFYRGEVGEVAFDVWKKTDAPAYQMVMDAFEVVKCQFAGPLQGASSFSSPTFRVPVPPTLHSRLLADDKAALQVNHGSSNDIELTEDDMVTFFEPVIASILHLATSQINKIAGPANGGGSGSAGSSSSSRSGVTHATRGGELHCNKMLLVGGFASSPYLQGRLQGSVIYGSRPELIHARRSRLSYGLRACAPYQDGAPDLSHLVGHIVRLSRYGGDATDVSYVDDASPDSMHKIADLTIDTPPDGSETGERLIHVKLLFGRTEIGIVAEDLSTGVKRQTRARFASY
ncbi:MAG: hypothetical protein WDW38_001544 [Sanguina aurantia]